MSGTFFHILSILMHISLGLHSPGSAEPLVGGQGGKAYLKLKAFWFLNVPRSGKSYPVVSF